MINVLFSSCGRRVELVNAFKEAKEELGVIGTLIGADIDELAPAMSFVDNGYIVPRVKEVGFIDAIIEICKKEKISIIIPTIDTELTIYSENKERIERESGAKVMVCDSESVSIIRNKIKTYEYLKDNGFNVPRLITDEDIDCGNYTLPLFIKPLDGSSSIDNFKVNTVEELNFFRKYVPNPMIQEFAEGQEYCVDVFSTLEGEVITVVPKVRLAHRSGEITKAKVTKDRELIEIGKRIAQVLKAKGEINFDCIRTKNGVQIIEINGRFAGGAPISFKAGANSPKNLYKELNGETLSYNEDYKDEFIALRFDSAIYK